MGVPAEPDAAASARHPSAPRSFVPSGLAWLFALTLAAPALAVESRSFDVGAFHALHFTGGGTVLLSQNGDPRLTVEGPAAALDAMTVTTRDGTLYIDTAGATAGLSMRLQVDALDAIAAAGDGHIIGTGLELDLLRLQGRGGCRFELHRLEAQSLEVVSSGATRFELSGQVEHQRVQLRGSGAYLATGLISNRTTISVAGASDVRLWADERLDVEVAGSADIRYAGSPLVEQRVTGVASVLRIPQIVI